MSSNFTLFNDRFDPAYYDHLLALLSDIDGLCKSAIAPGKSRSTADGKFTNGIRIDFAGLAATTLLGVDIEGETKDPLKAKIADRFKELLSTDMTNHLAEHGIYLKVRFIFSYIYSSYAKSLIEAEASLSRPRGKDRKIVYNFDIQSSISPELIGNSTIYRSQVSSLKKIATMVEANPTLVMSLPEYHEHTLQVRFSVLPMPFCLMIVNDKAYSDPYLFAQEKGDRGVRNLFYHSPIQVFGYRDPFQSKYYSYLTNHFDYLWNNEVTLYCKDATEFDNDKLSYQGLARIRRPDDLRFDQKERRIADYLNNNGIPFDQAAKAQWRNNIAGKLPIYLGEPVRIAPPKDEIKPVPAHPASPSGTNQHLFTIGKDKDDHYFFNLSLPAQNIKICFRKKKPELVYLVMLHLAIAAVTDKRPVIHRRHKDRPRVLKHILNPLTHAATNGHTHPMIDMTFLVSYILDRNRNYSLRIPKDDIDLAPDWDTWAEDLTYPSVKSDHEKQHRVTDF